MRVIKIGGSAVTHKKEPLKAYDDVIKRIGEEIKPAYPNLILTHGTGSYGHPLVLKQNLHITIEGSEKILGISNVKYWVNELTQKIFRSLVDAGIPTFPFHPSSFIILENDTIKDIFLEPIERFLKFGVVPLIPADGPFDRVKGMPRIASGDYLSYYLARHFKAEEVIFTLDVDGLYYRDQLIRNMKKSELEDIIEKVETEIDATGGMRGKLHWVLKILNEKIPVTFLNLTTPGRLKDYLSGKEVIRTRFIP